MTNVKCKHCKRYRYEWCRCIDDSPDPDILRGCSYFIQKTNADHIRFMSDEELAKFLLEITSNSVCFGEGMFPYHPCPQDQDCEKCGLGWLKQPYKEDT